MAARPCNATVTGTKSILNENSILSTRVAKNWTFTSVNGTEFGEAMQLLTLKHNLPFVTVTVGYRGREIEIENVLVDTGSASTIFSADLVASIEIIPLPDDTLYIIRGVGGSEAVFSRVVDYIQLGTRQLPNLEIEVGGMDYGFDINGILGMDFLTRIGAIIDLRDINISFHS